MSAIRSDLVVACLRFRPAAPYKLGAPRPPGPTVSLSINSIWKSGNQLAPPQYTGTRHTGWHADCGALSALSSLHGIWQPPKELS